MVSGYEMKSADKLEIIDENASWETTPECYHWSFRAWGYGSTWLTVPIKSDSPGSASGFFPGKWLALGRFSTRDNACR